MRRLLQVLLRLAPILVKMTNLPPLRRGVSNSTRIPPWLAGPLQKGTFQDSATSRQQSRAQYDKMQNFLSILYIFVNFVNSAKIS